MVINLWTNARVYLLHLTIESPGSAAHLRRQLRPVSLHIGLVYLFQFASFEQVDCFLNSSLLREKYPYIGRTKRSECIGADVARDHGIRSQVGMYPNPTVAYFGEEMGNENTSGQQGAFLAQTIVLVHQDYLARVEHDMLRRRARFDQGAAAIDGLRPSASG